MKHKIIIFLLSIVYIYCASYSNNTFGVAGEKTAEETPARYLACYALPAPAKNQCTENARFEAERLGFKSFLNDRGLSCESVDEGPEFIEDRRAYLVKCSSGQQYFMRFNYETNDWEI